jgi:hypothetical protein
MYMSYHIISYHITSYHVTYILSIQYEYRNLWFWIHFKKVPGFQGFLLHFGLVGPSKFHAMFWVGDRYTVIG